MERITYKYINYVIDPLIGSALIGVGGSLVNGFSSLFGGSSSASKDFKHSKQLMQFQNDLNLQNWNTMNTYNSPAAIRQRQRAAGMNPLLHDLEGAAQPMAAVGQSSFSGSAQEQANRQAAISNMTQAANVAAQTSLLKAQKENIEADTLNKKADTPRIQYEASTKWLQERFYQSWWNNEHSALAADLAQIINQRERFRSQYFPYYDHSGSYSEVETDFNRMFDDVSTELDNLKKDGKLKDSQADALSKSAHASLMSAAAALKQAEVADSRKEYQNALDDAVKAFQDLRSEMLRLGFNESDGIGARIIKKIAEGLGMNFGVDSDLKSDPEFRSKHRQNRF